MLTNKMKKSVNWHSKTGYNQLHLAASNGDLPSVKKCVALSKEDSEDDRLSLKTQRENKLDIATRSGDRAIHMAIRSGHEDTAKYLAESGCDIKALGAQGENVLHVAAKRGLIRMMNWLIEVHKFDVNGATAQAMVTCVHAAAEEDRSDTLRFLEGAGAAFDAVDSNGDTALHYAARKGAVGAVNWLVEKEPVLLRRLNKVGKDAEAVARDAGRSDAANALAAAKRDPKRRRAGELRKALARGENLTAIQSYFEGVPELEVEEMLDSRNTKTGANAILEACAGGDLEVVKYVLNLPPNSRDLINSKTGESALHVAAHFGYAPLVSFLLNDLEMDPSRADANGMTATWVATKAEQKEVLRLIKEWQQTRKNRGDLFTSTKKGSAISTTLMAPQRLLSEEGESTTTEGKLEGGGVAGDDDEGTSSANVLLDDGEQLPNRIKGRSTPDAPVQYEVDADVKAILDVVGLNTPIWVNRLGEQGFDRVQSLMYLMEDDLRQMTMSKGHRRVFMSQVDALKKAGHRSAIVVPASPLRPSVTPESDRKSKKNLSTPPPADDEGANIVTSTTVCMESDSENLPRDLKDDVTLELLIKRGDSAESTDSASVVVTMKKRDNLYYCSCGEWASQKESPAYKRTCEHLRLIRGERAERLRVEAVGAQSVAKIREIFRSNGSRSNSNSNGSPTSGDLVPKITSTPAPSLEALNRMRKARKESTVAPHHLIKYSELVLEGVIGEGSFGVVYFATWRGMRVAVKALRLSAAGSEKEEEEISDLKREANMMARVCNHANVVQFVGMVMDPKPSVVMAYMEGGSLEDLLVLAGDRNVRSRLSWIGFFKLLRDAAAGLNHLHRQNVIHRDIAARNLLVDSTGTVRVADFGFARVKEESLSKGFTMSHVGPIKWMAPEALRNRQFSERSDVFSFGVTMWEIMSGERPWSDFESMDVVFRVYSGERMALPKCPDLAVVALIEQCWHQLSPSRPSMEMVLNTLDEVWDHACQMNPQADESGGMAMLIVRNPVNRRVSSQRLSVSLGLTSTPPPVESPASHRRTPFDELNDGDEEDDDYVNMFPAARLEGN